LFELTDALLIASGGEARIFEVPGDASLVAKIYHKPIPERAAKLQAMLANPPADPAAEQNHHSIAWPVGTLALASQKSVTIGFLMPKVTGMKRVMEFFNPKTRRQSCPCFNYFYLHRAARNLAAAVKALHDRGYVIGDINESNILLSERALATLVDTDSFQVWDAGKGTIFRCRVGKPEFTPPELQGQRFAQINRMPHHDYFGLAVIFFQMLMEGTHPYAGTYKGAGDPPPYEQRIVSGHFPYGGSPRIPYAPAPAAPSFEVLHPNLRHLFQRSFQDGYMDPKLRPDTQSWLWALEEAENSLVTCWQNDQHIYGSHLDRCPWCERTKLLGGRDPFPSLEAVKRGDHLKMPPRARQRHSPAPQAPNQSLPVPRRIPPSTTTWKVPTLKRWMQPRAQRTWPHGPNNTAWQGFFLSLIAFWLCTRVILPLRNLGYLLGIVAVVFGLYGEYRSRQWDMQGKGRMPSRIAIGLGAVDLLIYHLFEQVTK
jgi:DNA-binding helix-hairpin-helix protein with protein kinase domain